MEKNIIAIKVKNVVSIILPFCLSALLPLTTACSEPDDFVYVDDVVVPDDGSDITVTDEQGNPSKLAAGTTVGIYVIGPDGNAMLVEAEADEEGNVVLPAEAQGGTLIAYSPYQEEWGTEALFSQPVFTVKSNQSSEEGYNASDLMVGSTAATTRAAQPAISFNHLLAKVAIHVVDETGRVDLSRISAQLLNVNNSVRVDLPGQSVTTISDSRAQIAMLSQMITDWRISSYAIVAPQYVAEGSDFYAITLYGNRHTYTIPEATTLQGGKTYTINLRLTDYGLLPDGWFVSDWDEEGEQQLDAFAVK